MRDADPAIPSAVINMIDGYNLMERDLITIHASVRGGVAYRGFMIKALVDALREAHRTKEETGKHLDIAQVFYRTNASVREWLTNFPRGDQICELRSTLCKNLSLTQIFKPPIDNEPNDQGET